jgi:hypothetical protein
MKQEMPAGKPDAFVAMTEVERLDLKPLDRGP